MDTIYQIRTEKDYDAALARAWEIFHSDLGSPEGEELERLVTLIEAYEDEHYPIGLPSLIETIESHMSERGLTRSDLVPIIGSEKAVSEVLSGKRDITMPMARALHKRLGISAEVLMQEPSATPNTEAGDAPALR